MHRAIPRFNGGSITTTGTQTYGDAVTLGAAAVLTSTAGGSLTLSSAVNGAAGLTLGAGSGNVNLGTVGAVTPLASLIIASAHNLTAGAVTAASITQSSGIGTSTFSALLHATARRNQSHRH